MDDADLRTLIEAGVYDPDAPNADDRLATIEFLAGIGATVDEMCSVAHIPNALPGLGSIAALPKPTVSLHGLADRAGMTRERIEEIWRTLGLINPGNDVPVLSEEEAGHLAAIRTATQFLPESAETELLRTAGTAAAHLGDALIQAYLSRVETEEVTELAKAQLASISMQVFDANMRGLEVVLKRHMTQSSMRLRSSHLSEDDLATMAVGFVDLVGFTSLSMNIDAARLAQVIGDFEALAVDTVNAHGGWVIKLIGDAVMFGAVEPFHAIQVCTHLLDALGDDQPDMTPSGGVAYGQVLARSGDYFGPVVNIASRAASEAIGHEVLVTDEVRAGAGGPPDGWALEQAGQRRLKGIDDPVALWSLHRRSDPA